MVKGFCILAVENSWASEQSSFQCFLTSLVGAAPEMPLPNVPARITSPSSIALLIMRPMALTRGCADSVAAPWMSEDFRDITSITVCNSISDGFGPVLARVEEHAVQGTHVLDGAFGDHGCQPGVLEGQQR